MEIDPPPELDYAMRCLRAATGRLRALDEAAQGCMSARIRRVAGQHRVSFLLYLCVYSAWPDITLCARFVTGFAILGHIECPPFFRPLLRPSQLVEREVLLEDADELRSQSPEEADQSSHHGSRLEVVGGTNRQFLGLFPDEH